MMNPPIQLKSRRRRQAFSLAEVVIASGLVVFAILPIMGLTAVGMNTLRDVKASSTEARIIYRIKSDLALTPFEELKNMGETTTYYDYEGFPSTDEKTHYYTVVVTPGAPDLTAVGVPEEVKKASLENSLQRILIKVGHGYPDGPHTNVFSAHIAKSSDSAGQSGL